MVDSIRVLGEKVKAVRKKIFPDRLSPPLRDVKRGSGIPLPPEIYYSFSPLDAATPQYHAALSLGIRSPVG